MGVVLALGLRVASTVLGVVAAPPVACTMLLLDRVETAPVPVAVLVLLVVVAVASG